MYEIRETFVIGPVAFPDFRNNFRRCLISDTASFFVTREGGFLPAFNIPFICRSLRCFSLAFQQAPAAILKGSESDVSLPVLIRTKSDEMRGRRYREVKFLKSLFVVVLIAGLAAGQTGVAPNSAPEQQSGSQNVTEILRQLQEKMAQQQKAMEEQQKQIAAQQQELERLKKQVTATPVAATNSTPASQVVNASLNITNVSNTPVVQSDTEKTKESPLSFRIGGAEFTPGGFMDFTTIFRSTNVGSLGTNFFAIPYSNVVQGHLSETRLTAQNSRISLKAASKFGRNDVTGYYEMDFLGNDAANVFVTSNSHTLRQRLFWLDLKRGNWEILGGQSWSWLTPNRVGLSPNPSDIFYSQDMDFNYQVGLTWTRAPQFRVAYHPNKNWAFGVALENPQQFVGQGAEVIFPVGLNAVLGPQFDAANNSATPNVHPDIIPKIAYDTDLGGKHFHAEAVGLVTSVRTATLPGGTFTHDTVTGGGGSVNLNLEVVKNLRLIANTFYSDGGGRYIFGMGPQAVVRPDGTPSLVHSGSGIGGFEWQVAPKTMIYSYYGGAYFQRNFFPDTSAGAKPGTFAGFGAPATGNTTIQNRAIQEGTIGWIQTFWKNPQYGALQLITQASYVTRAPWSVALGAPKNAHLGMGWVDIRYVLP